MPNTTAREGGYRLPRRCNNKRNRRGENLASGRTTTEDTGRRVAARCDFLTNAIPVHRKELPFDCSEEEARRLIELAMSLPDIKNKIDFGKVNDIFSLANALYELFEDEFFCEDDDNYYIAYDEEEQLGHRLSLQRVSMERLHFIDIPIGELMVKNEDRLFPLEVSDTLLSLASRMISSLASYQDLCLLNESPLLEYMNGGTPYDDSITDEQMKDFAERARYSQPLLRFAEEVKPGDIVTDLKAYSPINNAEKDLYDILLKGEKFLHGETLEEQELFNEDSTGIHPIFRIIITESPQDSAYICCALDRSVEDGYEFDDFISVLDIYPDTPKDIISEKPFVEEIYEYLYELSKALEKLPSLVSKTH